MAILSLTLSLLFHSNVEKICITSLLSLVRRYLTFLILTNSRDRLNGTNALSMDLEFELKVAGQV